VKIAGMVICRQRPGTAKGHCFISLEDETGIANLFVPKATFHAYRLVITAESFLLAEGRVQIGEGNQATVYVISARPMPGSDAALSARSHDFR
jgi:error-prone DNA polymerase